MTPKSVLQQHTEKVLKDFDDKFQWHENASYVFVNKRKELVREYIKTALSERDKIIVEELEKEITNFQLNCSVYKANGALGHDIYAGCDCGIQKETMDKAISIIRGEEL